MDRLRKWAAFGRVAVAAGSGVHAALRLDCTRFK